VKSLQVRKTKAKSDLWACCVVQIDEPLGLPLGVFQGQQQRYVEVA
jgi:hypothetical protein